MAGRHRPISLANLRGFEAAARRLSFTLAAEELHLTQSSISRQIRNLEEEVGRPLFRRGIRRLSLTPAGERLLGTVQPQLHEIDRTVAAIRGLSPRKRVTVTTFASAASMLLVPSLPAFSERHPAIDIRVDATDLLRDLQADAMDLALRQTPLAQPPASAVLLTEQVVIPVLSPKLRAQIGPVRRAADLLRATFLFEDSNVRPEAAVGSRAGWETWFAARGLALPDDIHSISLSYTYQLVDAAVGGQGIMLAPSLYVREHLKDGRLVVPLDAPLQTGRGFFLVANPGTTNLPHVAAFRQWLIDCFAGHAT